MPSIQWVVKFTNSNVDANNYQIVDVHQSTGSGGTKEEDLAQILAYFTGVSGGMASGTRIVGVGRRANGEPGFTAQPFPTTEYAAVVAAALTDGFIVPAQAGGYATPMGSGGLAPLGTSISVSEFTATPGPSGRGRHFLPFVSEDVVSAGGTVGTGHIAIVEDFAKEMFLGVDPGGGASTAPIASILPVISANLALAGHPVTIYRPQPVFSNLESRRR